MTLEVIGAGVGRTGTYSLRMALNKLGFGKCHHMDEIVEHMPAQFPLWLDVLNGRGDWEKVFAGYKSTVDWPTARYFRELHTAYPSAKFILSHRSPESWAESFSGTIYKLMSDIDKAPPQMRDWLMWVREVIRQTGFPIGLTVDGLKQSFIAHNEEVKRTIPAKQLLVHEAKEGWGPLCAFLGVEVPDEPYPRTNNRQEFWDLVAKAG